MSKETEILFKNNEGQPLTTKAINSPDTAMQILILATKYAFSKGLFKEMNDIAVVNKAIEDATKYVGLQRYIIEHYWELIKEIKQDKDGKPTMVNKRIPLDDIKIVEEIKTALDIDVNILKIDLIQTPELDEGEEGTHIAMLNSSPYGLEVGQLVLRINNKIHIPLNLNVKDYVTNTVVVENNK